MSAFTREELIRLARSFYPTGYPIETDDDSEPVLAYQRTPEYARWEAAWEAAMNWKECDTLIQEVMAAFPSHHVGRFSQPRMASCVYSIVSEEKPDLSGGQRVTRVVGALSVLAPVYLVYVMKELRDASGRSSRPRLSFTPSGEEKLSAHTLARLIERHLGYRPFPLEWADVPLPEVRVGYLHTKPATLLTALFSDDLENLP
ncbi:hypothetical protein [Archangium sp.]|uniref:hypothetical protein n=1 Tax=Archangium sp. TaxID=1872627 RepID=UPI00286B72FC|nr:hypothetical protein [Archangium sp.]